MTNPFAVVTGALLVRTAELSDYLVHFRHIFGRERQKRRRTVTVAVAQHQKQSGPAASTLRVRPWSNQS